MKKLLLLLLCLPLIGFGQCVSGDCVGGWGTLTQHGSKYIGNFENSQKHGKGTLTFNDGEKYDGEWKHNNKHGQGVYYYRDGSQYKGEWKDDRRNGKGIFTKPNGDKHEGEWKDDNKVMNGLVTTITFNNYGYQEKYQGGWKDGKKHGKGTFTYASQRYEGEWKDDNKHGYGKITYSKNGDTYEGEWKNGKRHGKGTFTCRKDEGVYTYASRRKGKLLDVNTFLKGDKYSGGWKNDKRHGKGTLIRDRDKYSGGWKNGSIEEIHVTYANGDEWYGRWFYGPHGEGKMIYADGTIKKGEWYMGELSKIAGCMDEQAINYNKEATIDDQSCIDKIYGCMNPKADNYSKKANVEDESCSYKKIISYNLLNLNFLLKSYYVPEIYENTVSFYDANSWKINDDLRKNPVGTETAMSTFSLELFANSSLLSPKLWVDKQRKEYNGELDPVFVKWDVSNVKNIPFNIANKEASSYIYSYEFYGNTYDGYAVIFTSDDKKFIYSCSGNREAIEEFIKGLK